MKAWHFAYVGTSLVIHVTAAVVKLGKTTILGRDLTIAGQEFFGGIPYAEPPIGDLRFRPPVPKLELDTSIYEARDYGPGCIQPSTDPALFSEDCLTINVWRPSRIPSGHLVPVMAWFYGGGFAMASASDYNGTHIVKRSTKRGTPIIYVNFNYRIGPFGFPQGREAVENNALNFGLKDQLVALEWIQHNIVHFGGDRSKVTVFGISAGAVSIAIHQLRPEFVRSARAMILQSGSAASPTITYGQIREKEFADFISGIPACAPSAGSGHAISCLRSTNSSVEELSTAVSLAYASSDEMFPFVPNLDGPDGVYPTVASKVLRSGNYARIPFISGTTLDEGTFVPDLNVGANITQQWLISNYTPIVLRDHEHSKLARVVKTLLRLYPEYSGSPFNSETSTFGLAGDFKRISAIFGDLLFQSQRRLLQEITAKHNLPSYGYLFTDRRSDIPPVYGIAHASEKPYVYGNYVNFTTDSQVLSEHIMDYWISFATSLNPNDGKGAERPFWPQYNMRNKILLQLDGINTTEIPDTFRQLQLSFMNAKALLFHH